MGKLKWAAPDTEGMGLFLLKGHCLGCWIVSVKSSQGDQIDSSAFGEAPSDVAELRFALMDLSRTIYEQHKQHETPKITYPTSRNRLLMHSVCAANHLMHS